MIADEAVAISAGGVEEREERQRNRERQEAGEREREGQRERECGAVRAEGGGHAVWTRGERDEGDDAGSGSPGRFSDGRARDSFSIICGWSLSAGLATGNFGGSVVAACVALPRGRLVWGDSRPGLSGGETRLGSDT